MAGIAAALADLGLAVALFDFPYMHAGRKPPDPAPALIETWRTARDAVAERTGGLPLVAGGKSLGGRIASMAVAEGMAAEALVFLGYPLHPPGRTDKLRRDHLAQIRVPMLFLQGSRDAFAQPGLLAETIESLGAPGNAGRGGGRRPLVPRARRPARRRDDRRRPRPAGGGFRRRRRRRRRASAAAVDRDREVEQAVGARCRGAAPARPRGLCEPLARLGAEAKQRRLGARPPSAQIMSSPRTDLAPGMPAQVPAVELAQEADRAGRPSRARPRA